MNEDTFPKVLEAIALIQQKEGKNRGVAGDIPCPVCTGKLRYTIAKVNGHIWGICETEGCLRWIIWRGCLRQRKSECI